MLAALRTDALTDRAMNQSNAWRMIRRRAAAAGITAPIGNHTFRATGITAYLANGGALEHAQKMDGTEGLYVDYIDRINPIPTYLLPYRHTKIPPVLWRPCALNVRLDTGGRAWHCPGEQNRNTSYA